MFLHSLFQGLPKLLSPVLEQSPSITLDYMKDQGVVSEPIYPQGSGRINLHGVLWLAAWEGIEGYWLPVGTPVEIVKRVGLTLWVSPLVQPTVSLPPVELIPIRRPILAMPKAPDHRSAA